MKILLAYLMMATLLMGCSTTRTNPETGIPEKVYDPVKTEAVKAALEPLISGGVRRAIQNSPEHAPEVSRYIGAVADVFCEVSRTGAVDPVYVVTAIDAALIGKQNGVDPYIIDLKNGIIALYKINYGDRFRAELSPEKWPKHVAELICNSLNQALADSGFQVYRFEPIPPASTFAWQK